MPYPEITESEMDALSLELAQGLRGRDAYTESEIADCVSYFLDRCRGRGDRKSYCIRIDMPRIFQSWSESV